MKTIQMSKGPTPIVLHPVGEKALLPRAQKRAKSRGGLSRVDWKLPGLFPLVSFQLGLSSILGGVHSRHLGPHTFRSQDMAKPERFPSSSTCRSCFPEGDLKAQRGWSRETNYRPKKQGVEFSTVWSLSGRGCWQDSLPW